MSDTLLSYFEQELRFIRDEASQFAARHPGAANSLGINQDGIDDPQVTRLIESVALLNGKLQQRLDESFPELTESLIRLLFPHYLRPIPSYSLLDFVVNEDANATHQIPVGTEFELRDEQGESAIFRTTENVALYPLKIEKVNVAFAPFEFAKPRGAEHAKALIEITISAIDPGVELSELDIDGLKVHLKGDSSFALRLYDLLSQGTVQVCVASEGSRSELGRDAMQPVGFDVDDTILPYQAASFGGFKLLTEFFMFSERFNGFRFDFSDALKGVRGHQFKLQLFIDELSVDLARTLSEEHFCLFTTPIVNLHQAVSDPVEIDFFKKHYPIVLDASQDHDLELFSVDDVLDVTQATPVSIAQVYGEKFSPNHSGLRWQLVQTLHESGGLESSLKVADLDHISAQSEPRTWLVNGTVSDGIKAGYLPVTSKVECRESLTIPAKMELLRRPSLPMRSKDANRNVWSLLCHLHFNYHAILGTDDPKATLKNVFELYNHNQSSQNHVYIESIVGIDQEQVVAPIRVSGKTCFAYGTKITVTLDGSNINGGVTLFSHLLDRFFSYFAGFNSFTQVEIKLEGQDGQFMTFPRRAGCKSLL
ncbi:type VI secretion system baseplate subunit TssF [Vibrio tapetis subsp. quintayensis]|uniref:type VI secretion system baseplate subunit TssF n=1 Tax=Vibrio tapetis TaxID=52443 RepID=UPI0025B5273A|nr:type VI secretion system baseplate subunit TssF [Vibrio tapetis]MDN3680813.1 type VI secretion system baseplate subunit TssF [Vibrio tapetis subsp. quintayensis]